MPIRQFISDGAFSPEVVTAMSAAFDDALAKLRLTDRDNPVAQIVAQNIFEIARRGEHDPAQLCSIAVGGIQRWMRRGAGN